MKTARRLLVNAAVLLALIGLCPTAVRASSAEIESAEDVQPVAEESTLEAGDGVTVTFDAETGEVVFYSDGGTLGKDWISETGLSASAIKSIKLSDDSGKIYLPVDSSGIFSNCTGLETLDLSHFDTSNTASMNSMFSMCYSLAALDLSGFNTSNVIDMGDMFSMCAGLTTLDVSGFNTSNVKDMSGMFENCSSLTALDPGNFTTSGVTNMNSMFSGCSGLVKLNLNGFDTSNVTSMNNMFENCSSLEVLDLSTFDLSEVMGINGLFNGCADIQILKTPLKNYIFSIALPKTLNDLDGKQYTELPVASKSVMLAVHLGGPGVAATFDQATGEVVFYSDGGTLWNDWDQKTGWNRYNVKSIKAADDTGTVYLPADSSGIFSNMANCTTFDLSHFDTSKVTNMAKMFKSCNSLAALDLSSFDTSGVTTMWEMFQYCTKLTTVDLSSFDTSGVTTMREMFQNCTDLTTVDLSSFDTSNVTDMNRMFSNCMRLPALDLGSFDTSKVTDMMHMFILCESLTTLNVSSFNTSNVTNMEGMFSFNKSLTALDVSNFDTSNVTNMEGMFKDLTNVSTLDLSSFDTSNVTTMDTMFLRSGCTTIDLSSFDTSKVTNMHSMFSDCSSLTTIDLSSFDTSNVTDMMWMFYGCSSLTELDLSNFDTSKVTKASDMFINCEFHVLNTPGINNVDSIALPHTMYDSAGNAYSNLPVASESIFLTELPQTIVGDGVTATFDEETGEVVFYSDGGTLWNDWDQKTGWNRYNVKAIKAADDTGTVYLPADSSGIFSHIANCTTFDLSHFDTSKVTNMAKMFRSCNSLAALDLSSFDTSGVTTMREMFQYCIDLTTVDLSSFDTSNVTDMNRMFSYCMNLAALDLGSFDTSKVTDMMSMFEVCKSLTTLNVSSFDTSNVTNMDGMFAYNESLTALDVSNFDTSNVTDMGGMFTELTNVSTLDLSSFDTSNVTTMANMFSSSGYTTLDLSSFDTSKVTNMYLMFSGCSSLTTLDLSSFDTSNVTSMTWMFEDCSSLTELDLSNFDTSKVTAVRGMFDACSNLKTLDLSNFDTSNVTNMESMFNSCSSLDTLWTPRTNNIDSIELPHTMYDSEGNAYSNLPVASESIFLTELPQTIVGDGVTATFDEETGELVFYSDGGTLWKGWAFKSGLDEKMIYSAKVADYSGTVYLPANSHRIFSTMSYCKTFDLSHFDTSNVTDMSDMFADCNDLTSLNLSSFDTSNVKSADAMFDRSSLETLWTPRTNNIDNIELPCTMYDAAGNTYTKLPATQESILLAKTPEMVLDAVGAAFKTQSLLLGDRIGVVFMMDLSRLTDEEREAGYMTFDISGRGTATSRADFDETITNASGYRGFICAVSAIQMADTITATYHYRDGETISKTYSVCQYIESFNEHKDLFDQTTQDLVKALADYGHYMQLYLQDVRDWTRGTGDDQYAPMDLFYAENYDLDAIRSAIQDKALSINILDSCIEKATYSLVLDSRTAIRVYFTPATGANFEDIVFKLNGETVSAEPSGELYLVTIPGIMAHQLGDVYTLTAEKDGETVASIQVSAMSYVQQILNASSYAENTNALNGNASLYAYYAAAEAYKEAHTS